MEISKSDRLYKLYVWCLGVCVKIIHNENNVKWQYKREIDKTNLCHFVRVIFFTTPLLLFFNFLTYILTLAVVIVPFFLFPLADVGYVLLLILAAAAASILLAYLCYLGVNWARGGINDEIFQVVREYTKAKKSKICPYLNFKE